MPLISRFLLSAPRRVAALLLALSTTLTHTAANAQVGMASTQLGGVQLCGHRLWN